jgi:hypothetical protein
VLHRPLPHRCFGPQAHRSVRHTRRVCCLSCAIGVRFRVMTNLSHQMDCTCTPCSFFLKYV